jgi:hypothetical protein
MRKTILLVIFLVSLCGFSQKNHERSDSLPFFDIKPDVNFKRFRARLLKYVFEDRNFFLIGTYTLNFNGMSYIEGVNIAVDESVNVIPNLGLSYLFDGQVNFRTGVEFRFRRPTFFFTATYGYNGGDHGVRSRAIYRLLPRISLGIESRNEFFGPRLQYLFTFGKKKKRDVDIYLTYLINDEVTVGARLRFDTFEFLGLKKPKKPH